jgi:hypothetical protein
MEQKTPNPKCTTCKCYWKPDDTDIKTSGLYFKTCKKCRENDKQKKEKNKCPHGKRKNRCVECGGSGLCPHGKQKYGCVECGGSGICPHGKQKCRCVECGGNGLCPHGKQKYGCVECGGRGICPHKRIKSRCKVCNFRNYLVELQRWHIRRLFSKSNVVKRTKPTIEYLGCSVEYFIEYIEQQFKEGMNWDNIHLDHIKPVSKFNLDDEDEFLQCCNYKNFQPLSAKDNIEKGDKFTKEDEEEWIKRMEDLTI